MTKPRYHQDTSRRRRRGSGEFGRLAKTMGHEIVSDDWRARIAATHHTHQPVVSFLGRPVLGSEAIVDNLRTRFPAAKLVTSTGRLTFNLMHRRLLEGREDGEQLLDSLRERVLNQAGQPIEYDAKPFKINRQTNSGEWGVKIPLVDDGNLNSELDIVTSFCKIRNLRPTPQPISVRVAEVETRADAQAIAESAWRQMGNSVVLGAPEILQVD